MVASYTQNMNLYFGEVIALCSLLALTGVCLILIPVDWGYKGLGIFFICLAIWAECREVANRRLMRIGKYDYSKIRANQKWF